MATVNFNHEQLPPASLGTSILASESAPENE